MKAFKNALLFAGLFLLVLAAGSEAVEASAYTGYNQIGSTYQYSYGYSGNYALNSGSYNTFRTASVMSLPNNYYNYPTTPRAGGWFGGGAGWITGLRTPYYAHVTPSHYSNFNRPRCFNCYGTGYTGIYQPQQNYGQSYRVRFGGGFI